jgi:hypothetical protein
MTKAQKDNQLRFKKAQAEAKRLKAKNPKLTHTAAVKQAFKNIAGTSDKPAAKKIGAIKKKASISGGNYLKKLIKQQKVEDAVNKKYKNWEFPVPPVSTLNWTISTWSNYIEKNGSKIGAVKKQTGKTSIAIDRKIQALPVGKRISKSGNVYYEARANRSDKGRLLGVKKDINYKSLYKEYLYNEDNNYHTDNILLLAYNLGSKADLQIAKKLIIDLNKYGYSVPTNTKKSNILNKKLYPKLIKGYKKEIGIGAIKKPAISKHKDIASHNVKISVMSGVGKFDALNEYKETLYKIEKVQKSIIQLKNVSPEMKKNYKEDIKKELAYCKKMLTEYKTHARELKKLL